MTCRTALTQDNCLNCGFCTDSLLEPDVSFCDTNDLEPRPVFASDINFNEKRGLKFGHLNCNGLYSKFDELHAFLITQKFHCFTLNEIKLDKNFNSDTQTQYNIPGYKFFAFPYTKNRGGNAFYIHNDCSSSDVISFQTSFPKNVEVRVIKFSLVKTKPILVVNVYRSPSTKPLDFLQSFEKFLLEMSHLNCQILIMGDFNINLLDKTSESLLLKSLTTQFNLTQHINEPTRISQHTETLLDHIYGNSYFAGSFSGTFNLTSSDHQAVFLVREKNIPKVPPVVIKSQNFERVDLEQFLHLLPLDWNFINDASDSDLALDMFQGIVNSILKVLAPHTKRRVKGRHKPWMTKEVFNLIQERNEARKDYFKVRKKDEDGHHKKIFSGIQNRDQSEINLIKKSFVQKSCASVKSSTEVWNVYKKLTNKQRRQPDLISLLVNKDGESGTDSASKCSLLLEQYLGKMIQKLFPVY